MNNRFDVCAPRKKKDGGTFWHRVGTAFDGDKGVTVYLDSLPMQDSEGRCVLKLFEAKPRQQQQGGQQQDRGQRPGGYDQSPSNGGGGGYSSGGGMDDDIPFVPETRA